jgi:hypothetical protein
MPNTLTNVKDIKVAQNALQPFMATLTPLSAFSTNFSPEADPNDADLAGWKPNGSDASEGMKKYYAYRNRGVDDYLLGSVTMRVTNTENGSPSLANLGRIVTPQYAPTLPDRRNWLLVGIDAEEQISSNGTAFKVTREYRASGAGGWEPEIYSRT